MYSAVLNTAAGNKTDMFKEQYKYFKDSMYPNIFSVKMESGLNFLQSNLDGSNTDGSFTITNSNSFLSPYEILPIAQENKYLRKFSYFVVKLYVVCTH